MSTPPAPRPESRPPSPSEPARPEAGARPDRGPEPQPPEPPPPGSCCGRGCSPCIMEHHEMALEAWRDRHARWVAAGP
ncbi:MAG: oxidoreductase-like domain-containing protein [Pseudomonadota bacterium]